MRMVRLFSAEMRLEPLAIAPERLPTEATYSPPDSVTLPEYRVPATVVEKLLSCISTAALLLALVPPDACPNPLRAGAAVLEALLAGALEAGVAGAAGAFAVGIEAAFAGAAATGLKTIKLE